MFDHTSGYFPKDGPGGCSGSDAKSTFGKFFAWNCDKGAEFVLAGHVRSENIYCITVLLVLCITVYYCVLLYYLYCVIVLHLLLIVLNLLN